MINLRKIFSRIQIICKVSTKLKGDNFSAVCMFFGGLWFLINDTWKSQLHFSAMITYSGKFHRFYFEDIGDFELMDEIFLQTAYLQNTKLAKNPIILDLGANIGVSTLFFAMCWPNSEIHSVEPDPENFRRLCLNTKSLNNVIRHNKLIWSDSEIVTFYTNKHRGSSSSVFKTSSKQNIINLQASSLSKLLSQISHEEITLLKFDVEGAEEAIFSKFDEFNRIKIIAGELHHDYCSTAALLDKLQTHYNEININPLKPNRDYIIASK